MRSEALVARPMVLTALVALAVVAPLVIAGELSAADTAYRVRADALAETVLFADRTAAFVSGRLTTLRETASSAGRSQLASPLATRDTVALRVALRDLRPLLGTDVLALAIADANGDILAADPPDAISPARKLNAAEPLVTVALDRFLEQPYLSSPFGDRSRLVRSVIETVPIGAPPARGVLAAQLDLTALATALPDPPTSTTASYVIDGLGRLVIGRGAPRLFLSDLTSWSAVADSLRGRDVGGDALDPDGATALVAGAKVTEVGWYALATHTPGAAEADLGAALAQARIVRLGLAVVLLFGTYLFGRAGAQIVRQRHALDRLVAEVASKNEQLVAASKNKSEFLSNMSHELRTPLNAIIGFSDVLEQRMFGELNDRQAEYVRDIAGSGRHLLDLVNEILDLSKVEAGRMELEPSEFALTETIRSALGFVRERAARHSIDLAADAPHDLGTVIADERKVRQVLLNLLSNAVKFTPDGGWIRVSARRIDREIQVSVRDTGIGIAPEDQPKVFEEFQQVGRPSERSREGTGLGLTLAKRLIELHGGRLWVESDVGKGTTFTFALPVAQAAAAPP